jgi:hypothetical protein
MRGFLSRPAEHLEKLEALWIDFACSHCLDDPAAGFVHVIAVAEAALSEVGPKLDKGMRE